MIFGWLGLFVMPLPPTECTPLLVLVRFFIMTQDAVKLFHAYEGGFYWDHCHLLQPRYDCSLVATCDTVKQICTLAWRDNHERMG